MPPTLYLSPHPLSFSMFLIFFSSDYIIIQSHFCRKFRGVTVPCSFSTSPLFLHCTGFHCSSYCKWPCDDGAPGTMLKRRFCLHTRAEQLAHTITAAGDPLCWPPRHLASAGRLSFTSIQITCKEAAGPIRLAGCYVAPVDWCTAHTLLCYYSTKLLSVVLSPFVSLYGYSSWHCVFRLMHSVCVCVCKCVSVVPLCAQICIPERHT